MRLLILCGILLASTLAGLRRRAPPFAPALQPLDRRAHAHFETIGRLSSRCAGLHSLDNAFPQVTRIGLRHRQPPMQENQCTKTRPSLTSWESRRFKSGGYRFSYEGMVDFHWGFAHLIDAERMAAALSFLTSRPEIVLLRLSNYDDLDASVTYKDERSTRHYLHVVTVPSLVCLSFCRGIMVELFGRRDPVSRAPGSESAPRCAEDAEGSAWE